MHALPLQTALNYIRENRNAMDRLVEVLCEKETLTGDEFRELLSKYAQIPEENMRAANMQKQRTLEQQPAGSAAFIDIEASDAQ